MLIQEWHIFDVLLVQVEFGLCLCDQSKRFGKDYFDDLPGQ